MAYDLYSEFDIQKHKEKYINYLEVLIEPDGHVIYAVPSHQEKAIELAMASKGWTRDELRKACPPECWFDFLDWLLEQTGCISVWTRMIAGNPNPVQKEKLLELKMAGLYKGPVSKGE